MNYLIAVDNIKCGGCSHTIEDKVAGLAGVDQVSVDINEGAVIIEGAEGLREQLCDLLKSLGYPESGTTRGLGAVGAKVKSVASCAVGKMRS